MMTVLTSQKINSLKYFIVPLVLLSLLSFKNNAISLLNSPVIITQVKQTIEITINKNTTEVELITIKTRLAKEKFDFLYTTVRNNNSEIKDLSIEITGGNKTIGEVRSRYKSASDNDTIDPINIQIDITTNTISIKNANGNQKITTSSSTENEKNKKILISTSTTGDYDIKISEEEENGFKFSNNEETKEPLFFIDGIKSDSKTVHNLNESTIATMNVLKGDSAMKKYGKEAKNGVIEIITKK
ncbi:hypothetical protein CLV90_1477 [Maribacter spongiicola]|uniref:TonB-dependent SusC/RagA subfamily outer membrane receptor n=1 Tax=Maribacter spongiicola TaxID=1206753 RepID=A0A4R7K8X4_9FLAO|nr:hypothetical protein [Maribacter spongiicola]TDT47401.1 hypothetical protein CLV90_1477 [Maribacter spongiicola]